MTRALPLLLALAGCAAARPEYTLPRRDAMGTTGVAPARAYPAGFDAAGWTERARAADLRMAADGASDAATMARLDAEKRLTAELDAAVGWTRACDTYWDATAGREVTDATLPGGGHFMRGTFSLAPVGPGETVAAIVCDFGAYQGSYALVRLAGPRAELLRAAYVGFDGSVGGPPSSVFATPAFEAGARTFETLALSRGIGDCGLLSQYRLEAQGVTLVQARARDCDDRPEAAPPPEAWPVVFPR